jgi:hypothetical protein
MFSVQPRLPFILPQRARMRRIRRPFTPSQEGRGPYRLPRDVQDRLTAALTPFRNREAAFALATFVARFWSTPNRIVDAFPIDRRELADRQDLGLSEKQIRSAIRTLEEVEFLDRTLSSGSRYKATEEGLRRKPIRFQFGAEYFPLFDAANKRATAARGRQAEAARSQILVSSHRASTASAETHPLKGPKSTSEAESSVLMGPLVKKSGLPPKAFEPNPALESALDRLLQGIRQSRGG